MSAGLEHIRQAMADYLNGQGVNAMTAWPAAPREEREEPVVAVSLRGCQVGPSGFQDYLGERYDESTGRWEERYGKKARLTLGLDIYAPEKVLQWIIGRQAYAYCFIDLHWTKAFL